MSSRKLDPEILMGGEVITTSWERNPQYGKKWSKKFVLDSLMILFSSFFGNTCVQKDKISNLILIKKTPFVKKSIIHLLTKIEFDGEKVPKTYENEFWNRHNAKDWRIFTVFLVTAKPYKNQYKQAKPWGCNFTPIQQLHHYFNTANG